MFAAPSAPGLIVSVNPLATPALNEVSDFCGWPVLMAATPLDLRREILRHASRISLLWLDDERHVGATTELLSSLATWQPAVRRIAIGYRMPADVEIAMRSAGVHFYLAAGDDLRTALEVEVAPWLHCRGRQAIAAREPSANVPSIGRSRASPQQSLHVTGPP